MKFKFYQRSMAPNTEDIDEPGGGVGTTPATTPTTPEPEPEDLTGLKNTVKAVRQERDQAAAKLKQLETQFKQFQDSMKGIDPVKYAQFEELQRQAELWNQKEIEIKTGLQEDFNRQIKVEQERTVAAETRYNQLVMRVAAEKAFTAASGKQGAGTDGISYFDTFYQFVNAHLRLDNKGSVEVIDKTGARLYSKRDSSKLMTPAEFFQDYATHPVLGYCFDPQKPNLKGGGMQPSQPTSRAAVDTASLSRTQRLTMARETNY